MADGTRAYLILGASGGIGSALARRLAGGARLALAGRTGERVGALATELGASSHVVDARDLDDVSRVVDQAVAEHGQLDGVVNCVGSLLLKPAHLTRPEEWADTVSVNLSSAFATVRAGARAMMDRGGSVVLVSSAAAEVGLANHEAIAAAKGGVAALARAAAATYAASNIRVNAVAPGLVETPLTERITRSPAARQSSEQMHALRRLGTPDDVASLIAWLLDPGNAWVTGQVIGIDGGLARVRSR